MGDKNRLLSGDTAIKISLEKQLEQGEKHRSNSAETTSLFERIIEIEQSHARERLTFRLMAGLADSLVDLPRPWPGHPEKGQTQPEFKQTHFSFLSDDFLV